MHERYWTTQELDRLCEFIDQGHGYADIARRLGRTEIAVILKAKRIGYRLLATRTAMTGHEIARLLGIGCPKTVTRWITAYDLPARNAGTQQKPIWRVQWIDLMAWLESPAHWMTYDPARCAEAPLREHLIEIRQGQPGWLTPGQAADRLGVDHPAVNQWIAKGVLPATRYGNWWVRESDLIGFVPPCERSKAGIPRGRQRLLVGPDGLVAGPIGNRRAA